MKLVSLMYRFPHKSTVSNYGGGSAEAALVPRTLDGREASARSGRAQLVVGSARWADASTYDPLIREHLKHKDPVPPSHSYFCHLFPMLSM